MLRVVRNLVLILLVVGTFALVRQLLVDRAPQKGVDGDNPSAGSLDTWSSVPRAPSNRASRS